MKQYLELVRSILDTGTWQENRTGIRTISQPGAMLRFDLQEGFPAVTTKKLAFKSAVGELIGFLRASHSAADFRALGHRAREHDDAPALALCHAGDDGLAYMEDGLELVDEPFGHRPKRRRTDFEQRDARPQHRVVEPPVWPDADRREGRLR